jgi:hypothetical protein
MLNRANPLARLVEFHQEHRDVAPASGYLATSLGVVPPSTARTPRGIAARNRI